MSAILRLGADFWRPWLVAAALAAIACAALAPRPAASAPMRASYYGVESGRWTASGARFDPWGMTAAHPFWPFGTVFRACFRRCGLGVVNDRGPAPWTHRGIDLSHGYARVIGLEGAGVATIDVEVIRWGPGHPAVGYRAGARRHNHRHRGRRR